MNKGRLVGWLAGWVGGRAAYEAHSAWPKSRIGEVVQGSTASYDNARVSKQIFLTNERNIFDKSGRYFCTFCTGSSEALE